MGTFLKVSLVLVLVTAIPASAVEPWALYDNFNSPALDPTRWRMSEVQEADPPGPTYAGDTAREAILGQLRLMHRGYGSTGSDNGGIFYRQGLAFNRNPALITAMRAKVRVLQAQAVGTCPTNPILDITQVRLRIQGSFFNTGTPASDPNDFTNNVLAFIGVRRLSNSPTPGNVLEVIARVVRCIDAVCSAETLYAESLGTALLGQAVELRMQWDPLDDRFIFQRDAMEPKYYYYYPISDTASPSDIIRRIQLTNDVPNCTTGPRPSGMIHLLVDDVYVNAAAAP